MDRDKIYMRLAIELALKGEGRTSPNPIVGAVLVKNGHVIGRGYHRKAGSPHAEVNAIRNAGIRARGATLYVTLEPCDHFGRTSPCTEAIEMSGIKRVVVGMKDPNPINNGAGMKRLIRYGIAVTCGVLEDEARAVNKPYIKFITEDIPYVTIKVAQTLDGKIATRKGDSRWITGEDSRRYVHALRAAVDAVMVGANTAMKDDPLLLSGIRAAKQPARVIVDGGLKIPAGLRIFSTVRRSPVIVAASERRPKAARLERKGAEVLAVRPKAGKVDLKDLLRLLAKRGIMHLLVEGGGELIAGLLEEGLADRALFFIAPKIVGGRNAVTSVEGRGVERIAGAIRVKDMRVRRFRDDVLLEGEISRCLPA